MQTRAAAGHTDIQAYSAGFKVVGCTATVDATDNTGTTGTGVPIYWLDGDKVADDYADFYDGSWDSRSPTTETGASVTTTSTDGVITGCTSIGTDGGFALGDGLSASMGNPSASNSGLYSANFSPLANSRRLYGLSVVFEVRASTDATLSALVVNDGTNDRTLDLMPGTFDYDADVGNAVTTVTLTATVNNSSAVGDRRHPRRNGDRRHRLQRRYHGALARRGRQRDRLDGDAGGAAPRRPTQSR